MSNDTFGQRLQAEREQRGLSIGAVAEIVGLDQSHLLALERNEFDGLPKEAAMMDCFHRYADCLDVDADLMIADYLQERERASGAPVEPPVTESASLPVDAASRPRPRLSLGVAAGIVVAIAMLATWGLLSREDESEPTRAAAETPVAAQVLSSRTPGAVAATPEQMPQDDSVRAPEEPPAVEPASEPPTPRSGTSPTAPAAARAAPGTPGASALRIPEHGVGTGVESRQLVGESDRFSQGARVHFWTRVLGAVGSERIDHVWLREGREVARVPLEIGGPSWRTYSVLTLPADATGEWAVEARDAAGRVLARADFACVP